MTVEQLTLLPLWYVVFLLSITCHEGAHAWAAYRGGDPTAYLGGQVSLNPLPHIQRELFGTVLVPLLSFMYTGWMMGWASAPYDPAWGDRYPRRAAWMAAAGPAANLVLAVLAFGALKAGLGSEVWIPWTGEFYEFDRLVSTAPGSAPWLDGLGRLLSIMLTMNVLLCVFNLVPFPPMDGAAVVSGFSERARDLLDRARSVPLAGLAGLLVAWLLISRFFMTLYLPIIHALWR